MNGFTIDSPRELREDTLGSNYAKTQNEDHFTAKEAEDAKEGGNLLPRMDADDRRLETEVGLGQTH